MDNDVQNVLFRKEFQIRLLTARGKEFEDFFAELMHFAHPQDFLKPQPWGRTGDLKCDGYLTSTKTVFQCYSPSRFRESVLIDKVNTDLKGAIQHWSSENQMKEWIFVCNEHEGLPPNVVKLLGKLKNEPLESNPSIKINWWLKNDLMNLLKKLSFEEKNELLGRQPSQKDFSKINYDNLQTVLDYLDQNKQISIEVPIQAPPLHKAENNQLSQDSKDFLMIGRRGTALIEGFFRTHHDPQFADKIAQNLKEYYQELENMNYSNEDIFNLILNEIDGCKLREVASKAAACTIMTYFFDSCEIFKGHGHDSTD